MLGPASYFAIEAERQKSSARIEAINFDHRKSNSKLDAIELERRKTSSLDVIELERRKASSILGYHNNELSENEAFTYRENDADIDNNEVEDSEDLTDLGQVTIYHKIAQNIYFRAFFIYTIWTFIGIIFYTYYDGWTLSTSFYYALEAGLSVGYCVPSEPNDNSKIFTIFYVLTASSIVSGILGKLLVSFAPVFA